MGFPELGRTRDHRKVYEDHVFTIPGWSPNPRNAANSSDAIKEGSWQDRPQYWGGGFLCSVLIQYNLSYLLHNSMSKELFGKTLKCKN